jgi:hypothetical protein
MRMRPDLVPLMRRDKSPPHWAIYSAATADWIDGEFKSRTAAERAARALSPMPTRRTPE